MYWTLELASKLEDAPWPATKEELIDYAVRAGLPLEVIENLEEIEAEGDIYETIEAQLAVGLGFKGTLTKIGTDDVERLESEIDRLTATLPPIRCFTIPGGAMLVSQCHVCRTVCRRAEREALRANAAHSVDEVLLCYLNRLSDYFYTLGRSATQRLGVEEKEWNV